jgi:hypothetical protein
VRETASAPAPRRRSHLAAVIGGAGLIGGGFFADQQKGRGMAAEIVQDNGLEVNK